MGVLSIRIAIDCSCLTEGAASAVLEYPNNQRGDEQPDPSLLHVLVTGGAGFVGAHVCSRLLALGCQVTVLDALIDFSDSYPGIRAARFPLPNGEHSSVFQKDLRSSAEVHAVLAQSRPDAVLHLAAMPLVNFAAVQPELAWDINVEGTRNLLEESAAIGTVRRFLFMSSSTVYGNFLYRPVDEDHPTAPVDVYGKTKLIGERMTRELCTKRGVDYSIIRATAVYGPGDRHGRVVQRFLEQAMSAKPLTIDNSEDRLDFTSVYDLVEGIVLALFSKEGRNQIFNLSRGEERSILELATLVRALIPSTQIAHGSSSVLRPNRGTLNIAKAQSMLGYRARFSLEEGLADYFSLLKPKSAGAL
jgi:nucleoside-diphosphate-sugar epimerase